MIYVTHDQIEAMTLADRIVLLKDGVIEQQGAPARSVRAPGHPLRRGLPRLAADELHPGQLTGNGAGMAVQLADGTTLPLAGNRAG